MRIIIYSLLMCSFSTLASVTVNKDTNKDIILDVSEVYVLGDNDTLTDAKAINIEQAKKSASDYAGTYVESELKLLDGKITKQQVRVLTAGFMEVISRTDKREINKSGSIQLNTKAKIKLSKQSIKESIAKLKTDPERQDKIKSLSDDNKRLRKKLIELTKKINTGASRTDLVSAREEILKDLNKNRSTAKKVFEKGSLLDSFNLDRAIVAKAIRDIDFNFFRTIIMNTNVTIGELSIRKTYRNGTYTVKFPVSWTGSFKKPNDFLSKYFKTRSNDNYIVIDRESNEKSGIFKRPSELMSKMAQRKIVIQVQLGSEKKDIVIGSYRNNDKDLVFNISNKKGVEVSFFNITENDLRNITSVSAPVIFKSSREVIR